MTEFQALEVQACMKATVRGLFIAVVMSVEHHGSMSYAQPTRSMVTNWVTLKSYFVRFDINNRQ